MAQLVSEAGGLAERPVLDVQLRRYARSYRRRLRKFAARSREANDLLYSFPAAAFTIGGGHGNPLRRGNAGRALANGAKLRAIANELELPFWTRRLPPEAFTETIAHVPNSAAFALQILNKVPKDSATTAMWFSWVSRANLYCDEEFALWLAKQKFWHTGKNDATNLLPLAAYSWYSRNDGGPARGFIERPWTRHMSAANALKYAHGWFMKLVTEYCRDGKSNSGRWFVTQRVSGLRFIPLTTPADLTEEGRKMNHCVAMYASKVAIGECLIYGIRRGNDHVATMEVGPKWRGNGEPTIVQLAGPYNDNPDESICRAADTWLRRQGKYPFVKRGSSQGIPLDKARWEKLWAPFKSDKGNVRCVRRLDPNNMYSRLERLYYDTRL